MFSRRSRFISFSCVLNDLLATVVAFLFAYGLRVWVTERIWHLHPLFSFDKYLPVLLAALAVFAFLGYVMGVYRQIEFRRPRDIASDVVKLVTLGMLALFAILFPIAFYRSSRGIWAGFLYITGDNQERD